MSSRAHGRGVVTNGVADEQLCNHNGVVVCVLYSALCRLLSRAGEEVYWTKKSALQELQRIKTLWPDTPASICDAVPD